MPAHNLPAKANANPTKAFFVQMLTRDIALDDCILDLIDNSVDGAWVVSGENAAELRDDAALSDFEISVQIDTDHIAIEDNCGGISLDDAIHYAFTFGRVQDLSDEFTVGVYGIGMKRAFFKMGRDILVESTHRANNETESFKVPIRVADWLEETSDVWDFDIDVNDDLPATGVRITVSDLYEGIANRISDPTYADHLRRVIARDYMIPLMRGLRINVNGQPVSAISLQLASGSDFEPMRRRDKRGEVQVEILAGMHATPPDDIGPDDKKAPDPSGWYIACNGRIVLAGDKTDLSGWGTSILQKWHAQYAGFVGIVLFSSDKPSLLPMTTTKRNVDTSSGVYQRTLADMASASKEWIKYTNIRKNNLGTAKPIEAGATPVSLAAIQPRRQIGLPKIAPGPSPANVNYSVDPDRMEKLAIAFGSSTLPFREVGLRSFDFAFRSLVDPD